MLAYVTGVHFSAATVRRLTEQAGAAYVAVQEAKVARLEHETPPVPAGPAVQFPSVDGAMVPPVGAEVETVALGVVQEPRRTKHGEVEMIHTTALSYFSRLADADTFGRVALVETQRRGTETAGVVCAVVDGVEWAQGFVDLHRPDAVRILDWAHAVEYLAAAAQAAYGAGALLVETWLTRQRHALRPDEFQTVLATLRAGGARHGPRPLPVPALAATDTSPASLLTRSLLYPEKRVVAQLTYAAFTAQGYPVGSGSVESANKVMVEARLKGAGMHWARAQVNPRSWPCAPSPARSAGRRRGLRSWPTDVWAQSRDRAVTPPVGLNPAQKRDAHPFLRHVLTTIS